MFYVYGTAGQVQSGQLHNRMAEVAGVHRTARVRPVRVSEPDERLPGAAAGGAGTGRLAAAAYAQTAGAGREARQPLTLVSQLMSTDVISIAQDASVAEGWQLLARHQLAQAPVLNTHGVLVGLLLRADLLQPALLPASDAEHSDWQALARQPVRARMHTPVPAVAADTDIRSVAQVLIDTGLPGLPVTDADGLVVGFITRTDILRAVVADPPLDLWS